MNIVEVKNVSKQYGSQKVLNNISLSIPKGSIFGLLGPNGAGKTTLIRMLTRITMPDEGKIFFEGDELNDLHIRQIGYLPEERGLYKRMTVGEQLLYLAELKGLKHPEAKSQLAYWSEKFGMNSWLNKPVESLSKGMQQKVQFVATVMHRPKLIILDEPFTGFDPVNANLLKEQILEMKAQGATFVFSTHRMESVEELCTHVALINRAEIVLLSTSAQLKAYENVKLYQVVCNSALSIDSSLCHVLSESHQDNYFQYEIELLDISPKQFIGKILPQTEIFSFTAKVPTMNDIFINATK